MAFICFSTKVQEILIVHRRSRKAKQWATSRWRFEDERRIIGSVFVIWSQRADRHRRAHPDWTRNGCNCCLPHRGRSFEWECWWPSAMRSESCEGLEWKCQHQFRYPCCSSVTHRSFTVHTATNPGSHCRQSLSFNEVFQSEFARFTSRMKCPAQTNKMKAPHYLELPQNRRGKERWTQRYLLCAVKTKRLSCTKISCGRGKCIKVWTLSSSTLFQVALIN